MTPAGSCTRYVVPSPTRVPRDTLTGSWRPSSGIARAGIPAAARASRSGVTFPRGRRRRVGPPSHTDPAMMHTTHTMPTADAIHRPHSDGAG